jgi:hypothetical protein
MIDFHPSVLPYADLRDPVSADRDILRYHLSVLKNFSTKECRLVCPSLSGEILPGINEHQMVRLHIRNVFSISPMKYDVPITVSSLIMPYI